LMKTKRKGQEREVPRAQIVLRNKVNRLWMSIDFVAACIARQQGRV